VNTKNAVCAPRVSVILTTYNFAKYAREAVLSLLNQQNAPSFELLVIDDASTDGTVETLADIVDARLNIHRNAHNLGVSTTLTNAFAMARGSYIARLDGDDRWRPDFLHLTCAALDADASLGFVYGDVAWMDSGGNITVERGFGRPNLPAYGHELKSLLQANYICAPALLARREAWQLALPWQERFAMGPGDWFASLSMAAVFPSRHLDTVLADYRIHAQGMHNQMIATPQGEVAIEYIMAYFFERFAVQFNRKEIREIRQGHRLRMASSALAMRRYADARRLYRAGLGDGWLALARPSIFRSVFALEVLGYARYEKMKSWLLHSRHD
jgi:glycosyltransferase involved in cell wall biosynthesis